MRQPKPTGFGYGRDMLDRKPGITLAGISTMTPVTMLSDGLINILDGRAAILGDFY